MGIGNIIKVHKEGENILIKFSEKESLTSNELVSNIIKDLDTREFSGSVILDMVDISYLDSSGLSVLLGIYKSASNNRRGLKIINANPQTKNVLDMCSFYECGVLER